MAPAKRTTSRPGAGARAATTAQRQAAQEAARKAAEEEAAREAEMAGRRADRASADNLPPAPDQASDDPNAPAVDDRGLFAELTDAGTGLPLLIDPSAVAHIGPGIGSVIHSDPDKAARGEHEMGAVTEISTIGGIMLKVFEDVETVAAVIGV